MLLPMWISSKWFPNRFSIKLSILLDIQRIIEHSMYIHPADINAVTGTVTTHAYIIFLNSFQSTPFSLELNQPTNTTDPTLQWVVDIGKPILLANNTVNVAPISIVKPVDGEMVVRSSPMVCITRLPQSQRPTEIPRPPYNSM